MRRVVPLAVGLVVSTLLLGGGWLASTLRERDARLAEARDRLGRSADTVRAAVDESLEELREREDRQPFYLYNHFYSPPDVLALNDPIAVSPLARPPRDARIVGHFQIEPGGMIRTPYAPDEASDVSPLARLVRNTIAEDGLSSIRELAVGESSGTMLGRPLLDDGSPPDELHNALSMRTVPRSNSAEQSPPPLALNPWVNSQAQDIQAAQAGDLAANTRVLERGRQAPRIVRRDVTWEDANLSNRMQQSQSANMQEQAVEPPPPQSDPSPRRRPSTEIVRRAMESTRSDVLACTSAQTLSVRLTVRGRDGRPGRVDVEGASDETEVACVRAAISRMTPLDPFDAESLLVRYAYRSAAAIDGDPLDAAIPADLGLDNMVQREAEVDYTPMAFLQVDGALVLHRLVSHEGASVVQGVVLDPAQIVEEWIPSVVARHTESAMAPTVVRASSGECALRRPASSLVSGAELCFAPAVLARATAGLDAELGWQIGALTALWLIVFLAAGAIVASARRAEALSRQKSAFVSAVSHELRTPLTTLRMHSEMLAEGMVSEARHQKVYGELVRESVRLARLVDNVLSLSRLEEGQRHIRKTEGDLRAHVRDVVEGQRRFVLERGFSLEGPREGEPIETLFDAQAIEQIVVNLLDNAVKYGGGEEKSIEVRVARVHGVPTIEVSDRGPGIPERERTKVFERFHRVEREDTAHAPGTGIGLALVAELAEAHGGSASVHPREDGGLVVRVLLGAETANRSRA